MTVRELFGHLSGPIAISIGLALGMLWSWEQRRKRGPRGMDIDTGDPIWIAAIERARASLPRFYELAAANPGRAFIKYALQTTSGATEHVWGEAISLGESTISADLETRPVDGMPASAPPYDIQISDIEDWRIDADDGRIYGAYTARAQIAYARKLGHQIPPHMLEIEKCLVDA